MLRQSSCVSSYILLLVFDVFVFPTFKTRRALCGYGLQIRFLQKFWKLLHEQSLKAQTLNLFVDILQKIRYLKVPEAEISRYINWKGSCMVSDDEIRNLVERAKKYDSEAFGKLYDLYFDQIYAYVFYRVGLTGEAEDLSEQVFLKALEAIKSFDWRGIPFSAWLFRIAHNLVIDQYRRNCKMTNIPVDEIAPIASETEGPEDLTMDNFVAEELYLAISQLTEDQQQVIILKFFSNLSNPGIAQFLDKPVGAVKSLQHRALVSLRRVLRGGLSDE